MIAAKAEIARSLSARIVGLIGKSGLDEGQGLIIPSCRQVHTFFMRFPIDIIFADRNWAIVGVTNELPPWQVTGYFRKAAFTLELPAGTISSLRLNIGDRLIVEEPDR